MHNASRLHPELTLDAPAGAGRALVDALRRAIADWQYRRNLRLTVRALQELDSATLRDLGFDSSELLSVAVESAGRADITRARLMAGVQRGQSRPFPPRP